MLRKRFGIVIAEEPVCRGHSAPWIYFADFLGLRPGLGLILGPRGGGKSYLSALDVHLNSTMRSGHATRILGGSRQQSEQVYRALQRIASNPDDLVQFEQLWADGVLYRNGSEVEVLACSAKSVRGPHIPTLRLDEVDEIEPELREAALGMCMQRRGHGYSTVMTSTWHRVGGPMSELMERGRSGEFATHTFCAFEILEACPEERSGKELEHCVSCELVKWCHEDREDDPRGLPKAKRAKGHYAIESLIQKVRATSVKVFESDYLCRGPRAEGLWFTGFDTAVHVDGSVEYDGCDKVQLAVDPGVCTGAVIFQVKRGQPAIPGKEQVMVLADYYREGLSAEENARAIEELVRTRCQGRVDQIWMDPAGSARTAIGPTVVGEYERAGIRPVMRWPAGSISDSLALLESFVSPADGVRRLAIHPRCQATIQAFQNYRRARRGVQWEDWPEDPQHPFEDMIDALRGGLRANFPEGRIARPHYAKLPVSKVF
jgi:hypothetical protein